jgi:CRP-like cAMP-binding protein
VLLSGVLFRFKIIADGQRQIISLHFAGDMPDLQTLFLEEMDHNLCAAGPAVIASVSHKQLEALFVENPHIGMLLWRDTLIDSAIFREWITNTGRRQAYARTAHLLCEIAVRGRAASSGAREMSLPLTQQHFADALGLSIVHVNRVLQDLRAQNLIRIGNGKFEVLDWNGLSEAGDFDPRYLHLREKFEF